MDGFKAYKYYLAIKQHFTNQKFDVFQNRGRMRGSLETFRSRNDHYIFEKLARKYPNDKDFIQYCAANFMYGHTDFIWNDQAGYEMYVTYISRKQSITNVFKQDLATIINNEASYDFGGQKIPDVIRLWLGGRITIETLVILNDFDGFVTKLKSNDHIKLLIGDDLLRLEKSKGFVKYDSYRVVNHYLNFIEELKQDSQHGPYISEKSVTI
jgi:hypothetical protein